MTKGSHIFMRVLSLALCLACMLPMAQVAAAEPETQLPEEQILQQLPVEQTEKTTLTTVVRKYAYYSYGIIGQMENGTVLTVLGQTSAFYKVDCYDTTGYIEKGQVELREDGRYYVNCQKESPETRVLTYTDYADALLLRHAIVSLTQEQLGKPYVYGATGLNAFDCSGLTSFVYAKNGIALTRRASTQLADGIIVAKEGMQVGDLVFFRVPGEADLCSHIGIYVGNNKIIHAGEKGVGYADLDGYWFKDYYLCSRRVICTASTEIQISEVLTTSAGSGVSGRTAN